MADGPYVGADMVEVEMTHPITLDQADLDDLANGRTVTVPVTLTSAVVIDAEFDDGMGADDD